MILDALVVRPFGLAACAVGLVGALIVSPFAATSESGPTAGQELLVKPFEFTFKRPLGQFDY